METIVQSTDQSAKPKTKLRWYQYSLRSLFILMSLVAIASSWFAVKMGQAKKQKEAVEALMKLGGDVGYSHEFSSLGFRIQGAIPPGPAWLRQMLGNDFFWTVNYVDLRGKKLSHIEMEDVNKLDNLQSLQLMCSQITDVELQQLKELKQLQSLDLTKVPVTDTDLEYLKRLSRLKRLGLRGSQITDVGLKHIKELEELQVLDLRETRITDAGLDHLKGLKQLKYFYRTMTKVTDAGVAKLQKALPDCKIQR